MTDKIDEIVKILNNTNMPQSDFVKLIEVPDRQNEIKDMMIEYLLKYKKT